jgi:hypothetical protein
VGCVQPTNAFSAVAYGVDDVTLGFDMEGSSTVRLLEAAPGVQQRRGKMLGEPASWGKWSHLLGRSVAHWKSDTKRLYVQAKLAAPNELCPPEKLSDQLEALIARMAAVGVVAHSDPWITRIDVAVDAACEPSTGKLLLDALEAVRPPNGWRTRGVGTPRSTVYFMARGSEKVLARSYCRNLKLKSGQPFGLIRLEAEHRFDPKEVMSDRLRSAEFVASIWNARYGQLSGTIRRLGREVQALEIHELVKEGSLTYQQGERLAMFLDMERLGLAESYYPASVYRQRRREAAKLGYANSDPGTEPVDADLGELLGAFRKAVAEAVL